MPHPDGKLPNVMRKRSLALWAPRGPDTVEVFDTDTGLWRTRRCNDVEYVISTLVRAKRDVGRTIHGEPLDAIGYRNGRARLVAILAEDADLLAAQMREARAAKALAAGLFGWMGGGGT